MRAFISDVKKKSKKIRLMVSWYDLFVHSSHEEFELELMPLYFSIFHRIVVNGHLLIRYSHFDNEIQEYKNLRFFEKVSARKSEDILKMPWHPRKDQNKGLWVQEKIHPKMPV